MTEVEPVLDFASSGRSGRRNALPDILGSPAGVNPGDLPLKLAELSLKGEAPDAFFFIITTLIPPDPRVLDTMHFPQNSPSLETHLIFKTVSAVLL
uniref:Uncharacterized protein n=1 Tax=Sparus aurata TaxID=8175 RepID=A0A671UXX0_SPAAU